LPLGKAGVEGSDARFRPQPTRGVSRTGQIRRTGNAEDRDTPMPATPALPPEPSVDASPSSHTRTVARHLHPRLHQNSDTWGRLRNWLLGIAKAPGTWTSPLERDRPQAAACSNGSSAQLRTNQVRADSTWCPCCHSEPGRHRDAVTAVLTVSEFGGRTDALSRDATLLQATPMSTAKRKSCGVVTPR
jgi:hypothetical protein